jgi:hypothetical protein
MYVGPHNFVKTIVRCATHRCTYAVFCLRVEREVPEPLRCSPGGGGGGGTTLGSLAPCTCTRVNVADLQRRVNDLLRRGGLGEWIRQGAVVVDC